MGRRKRGFHSTDLNWQVLLTYSPFLSQLLLRYLSVYVCGTHESYEARYCDFVTLSKCTFEPLVNWSCKFLTRLCSNWQRICILCMCLIARIINANLIKKKTSNIDISQVHYFHVFRHLHSTTRIHPAQLLSASNSLCLNEKLSCCALPFWTWSFDQWVKFQDFLHMLACNIYLTCQTSTHTI